MKATDPFKNTIEAHLQGLAKVDSLFAETLKKTNKSLDECITYIFNKVKESGCNGFADSEIYGMAVHYYDEDDIKAGASVKCKVVVNHTAEAIKSSFASQVQSKPAKKVEKKPILVNQTSLFS